MSDPPTKPERSALMARVRRADTAPEIAVRKLLHALGYRFRLHRKDLPGTPDIVFPARKKALFVHGCFWHRHQGCKKATTPKTRVEFWKDKFAANEARDRRKLDQLRASGWHCLVVWECETRDLPRLQGILREFLE